MDILLPQPLPIMGTLIGIAVLLSASAASAQGLQNLALGLTDRNYVPATLGRRNRFDVADKPVWIEVGLVSAAFLLFGTNEETYLAIYAAGVFILLSMTGWAAAKRLIREVREQFTVTRIFLIAGTVIAAVLTTGSTAIIFEERFFEGAWTYFLFVPILYAFFTYTRAQLGEPSPILARLGRLQESLREGFGFGQAGVRSLQEALTPITVTLQRGTAGVLGTNGWGRDLVTPQRVLIPLDGSSFAEEALPAAEAVCKASNARLTILSAMPIDQATILSEYESARHRREDYLKGVTGRLAERGLQVDYRVYPGSVVESTYALVQENGADLIITSTRGGSGAQHWLSGGVARKIINMVEKPVMLIQEAGGNGALPKFDRVLVTLDGSEYAERILPYVKIVAEVFNSEILLLSVPEVPEPEMYGPMADVVEEMRSQAETAAQQYLEGVAARIQSEDNPVRILVTGSNPARTIFMVSESEDVDVIMMATRGRGGLDRIMMGSVAERVVQHTNRAVFLLPVHEEAVPVEEQVA
jgi:nucleotide-binding universal stress UspA family protein